MRMHLLKFVPDGLLRVGVARCPVYGKAMCHVGGVLSLLQRGLAGYSTGLFQDLRFALAGDFRTPRGVLMYNVCLDSCPSPTQAGSSKGCGGPSRSSVHTLQLPLTPLLPSHMIYRCGRDVGVDPLFIVRNSVTAIYLPPLLFICGLCGRCGGSYTVATL